MNIQQIGNLLVEQGLLTEEQVDQLSHLQRTTGQRFGELAIEKGFITEHALRRALSAQFQYSELTPGDGILDERLSSAYFPGSLSAEALRTLRSQIQVNVKRSLQCVVALVGDADAPVGAVAANLAVVYAQSGVSTLLIEGNLREPTLGAWFKVSQKFGLADVLAGRAQLNDAVYQVPAIGHLSVLAAGTSAPNPQELLARKEFASIIAELNGQYEQIIIDSPDFTAMADAQLIARVADATVVVVRHDHSKVKEVNLACQVLRNAGANVLGVVSHD